MSIQERSPEQKPASQMTPEEWEQHKRFVDQQLAEQGKPPADWSKMSQPGPMSAEDREWALEVFERLGKLPK